MYALAGNGDILSYEDLDLHLQKSNVSGAMVARFVLFVNFTDQKTKREIHYTKKLTSFYLVEVSSLE